MRGAPRQASGDSALRLCPGDSTLRPRYADASAGTGPPRPPAHAPPAACFPQGAGENARRPGRRTRKTTGHTYRSLSSLLKFYPWKTEHLTVGKAHFRGVQRSGEVDAATAQAADGTPRPGCPCPWTSAARPRPAAPARALLAPWAHLRLAPLTSAAPVPPRGAPVHCGAEQQPWPLTLHGWRLTRDTNDGSRYRQRRMARGERAASRPLKTPAPGGEKLKGPQKTKQNKQKTPNQTNRQKHTQTQKLLSRPHPNRGFPRRRPRCHDPGPGSAGGGRRHRRSVSGQTAARHWPREAAGTRPRFCPHLPG